MPFGGAAKLILRNGNYNGDVLNGSGYYTQSGNELDLNTPAATTTWYLDVTGTLGADYADIACRGSTLKASEAGYRLAIIPANVIPVREIMTEPIETTGRIIRPPTSICKIVSEVSI